MAKEIKFNVKLVVDGKEQLVTATSTAEELRRVLDSAKTSSQKLNAALVNFNQAVMAANNVTNAISQISGALNGVTEESRSFSAAMNAANTMAGKSGEDFANLKGQVAELSKSIPVVRDELANGLYQVISNGVPEDNWIAFLQKSAKASVGGIADLGETVKVTSTIIKNYGLSWDKAGDVQDKIQLTAKNGVTSFEQLAQALPRVTGNAATLGVSIDELMATFATLTGVSGNTNEVATQMAAIFTALVKPSSEASKMAQQMGIEFDAAAIKAAGGMRNFLTDLDKNVKAYASKSGMLEQEIYGKLFGSAESLRALGPLTGQLAAKFNENVETMKGSAGTIDDTYGKVANSGSATLQMFQNQMSEYTDAVAAAVSGFMPAVNVMAKLGNTAVSILALNKALQVFCGINAITKTRIIATNAAALVWNATSVRMNALTQVISASFRGAAVSATTLKLAMQGLLISTGVGVAIVALTEAISYLMSSSGKAADSTKELSEAELAAQSARQQEAQQIKAVYSELDVNISKLKNFKGSKEEEKRIVGEMNRTYGETMGYYSTVSQWYTALIGNSKAYCSQMINEIRIRDLANKAADLQQKRHDFTHDANGKTRRFSKKRKTRRVAIGQVDAGDGKIIPQYADVEIKGSSDLEKANAKATDLYRQEQSVRKQMENLVKQNNQINYKHFKGYKPTAPTVTAPTPAKTTPKTTPGKHDTTTEPKTHVEELQAQLAAAQKEMGNAMTVEARVQADAKVADIQRQIDEATKGKVSIGAETEPTYIVQGSAADKRQSRTNAQHNIDRIRQDFEIGLIGKEEAQRQIADLNKQIADMGDNLKPLKLEVDAGGFNKAMGDIKSGWGSVQGIGNGIQGISDALEGNGNAWQQVTGLINGFISIAEGIQGIVELFQMLTAATTAHAAAATADAAATTGEAAAATANTAAKSGEAVADATASGAKMPFPLNLVAIAAGVAAVVAALAAVTGFATGGVIGGTSTSGDKKFARVNSGEMILNKFQQAKLFGMINGRYQPPTFTDRKMPPIMMGNITSDVEMPKTEVNVNLNANARKMLDALTDVKRVTKKSGRNYNV